MAGNAGRKAGKRKPLSATQVRTAKGPAKLYDTHGLFLRIDASGARRWVQRITIQGRSRELGLGSADLVSLAEAREAALANRKTARAGADPLAARRAADAVPTFAEAAKIVHAAHLPTWRNKRHGQQFISTLETYANPYLGQLKVSEVTSADVLAALSPIWIEKAVTAHRVKQRIGIVLDWAIAKRWRQDNPIMTIAKALPKQNRAVKPRKALPYAEVPACMTAVRASGAATAAKLCLEFAVLTASRSVEARLAQRDEFDLEQAMWMVPASRMKANKAHRVPLVPRTVEIVREAMALDDGSGLVFPSARRRGRPLSDTTLLGLVRELGYRDADVHGFRACFRTWAMEQTGFPWEVAEAALAHATRDKTAAAYARGDYLDKRRELMEAWADYLAAPAGAVLPLYRQ